MTSSSQQHCGQTRPRISAHNTTFAKVVVSPEAQSFTIHLDLLTCYSPFFLAALTGSFKEGREKLITLPDTGVKTFELYVHWLYHQRLPTDIDSPELLALYRDDTDDAVQCENLVHLYVFCDKYDISGLKRLCLDSLFEHIADEPQLPSFAYVGYAFNNLGENDPFCRFLVDTFCYWSGGDCWGLESIKQLPLTFLAKVLSRYTDHSMGGRDQTGMPQLCDYHDHKTVGEKTACETEREDAEYAIETSRC